MTTLVIPSGCEWGDWYVGSYEAGRPLETTAEVIYFARQAKQRLRQNEVHPLGVENPFLRGRHLPGDLGIEKCGPGEPLVADQLVQSRLDRPALSFHRAILARLTRLFKRAS